MTFSRSTLELFEHLLSQVQLPATAPNLVEAAQTVATARDELAEALNEALPTQAVADSECPVHGGIHYHDDNGDIQRLAIAD